MENFDDDDVDADFGLTLFDVKASSWISASYSREHFVHGEVSLRGRSG
jgi:serine/threonine protein phosphatase 1